MRPKTTNDVPMRHIPDIIKVLLPTIEISFPTIGLQNITATEYIENIYPMNYLSIFFLSNSNGKNGAMIA